MYTRETYRRQQELVKEVQSREGRWLLVASVALGLGQLALVAWADRRLARPGRLALEGGVFLAYMAVVGWLLWRYTRRMRAARPVCPECGAALEGVAARIAMAAERCDQCGGRVIAAPP